jgi:UDP-galactopyranose mutase
MFDYLIVGAGFAGCVMAERLAVGSGYKVLIVDKRPHIAGNAYDHYDDAGILVHKYGPHIFHTNSHEVFAYLSRFTEWRPYEHRVLASVDGQLVPIPINLDTVNRLYGLGLTSFEMIKFLESVAEPRADVRTSEDVVVSKVGRELYEKFFRNYTRKQWGLDPSELDASVTSRVPIRLNRDDRYFTDTYQAMPVYGYTRLFENMLDHPNIKIMLNTDYREIAGIIPYGQMIYTGPVDEYFDYSYGKLPYRSLEFKFETLDQPVYQPAPVINYPNEHIYTRITEFKYLTGQQHPRTTLVYEFPCGDGDPYYPVPRPENAELYKAYKALADSTAGVYFVGRLATYRYYNMDQVTAQALTLYARLTGKRRRDALDLFTRRQFQVPLPCSLLSIPIPDDDVEAPAKKLPRHTPAAAPVGVTVAAAVPQPPNASARAANGGSTAKGAAKSGGRSAAKATPAAGAILDAGPPKKSKAGAAGGRSGKAAQAAESTSPAQKVTQAARKAIAQVSKKSGPSESEPPAGSRKRRGTGK